MMLIMSDERFRIADIVLTRIVLSATMIEKVYQFSLMPVSKLKVASCSICDFIKESLGYIFRKLISVVATS